MAHAFSAKEFSSSRTWAVTAIHLSNTFNIVSVISVNTVALSPIIGCELVDTALSIFALSFCMGDPQLDTDFVLGYTNIPALEEVGVIPPNVA